MPLTRAESLTFQAGFLVMLVSLLSTTELTENWVRKLTKQQCGWGGQDGIQVIGWPFHSIGIAFKPLNFLL